MARIAGVNVPTNKRVEISLQYIYGIGPAKAHDIVTKLSIPDDRRVNQLSDDEVLRIRELIDREYRVEGDLRREVSMNIKRLMDLGCYRGLRHRRGLQGCRATCSGGEETRALRELPVLTCRPTSGLRSACNTSTASGRRRRTISSPS